jgi:hypothetical protein
VLAMIALTLLVIAMIASYSGALANPALHYLAVAVAEPAQVVDAIRGQDGLAVAEVGVTPQPANRCTNARPTPQSSPHPVSGPRNDDLPQINRERQINASDQERRCIIE